jgi:hypothetical protein
MATLSPLFREGEVQSLPLLRRLRSDPTIQLGERKLDLDGIDLFSTRDPQFGGQVKTRFNGYLDVPINGEQAFNKYVEAVRRYAPFWGVLQYADGENFDSPDFRIHTQYILDFKAFFEHPFSRNWLTPHHDRSGKLFYTLPIATFQKYDMLLSKMDFPKI